MDMYSQMVDQNVTVYNNRKEYQHVFEYYIYPALKSYKMCSLYKSSQKLKSTF